MSKSGFFCIIMSMKKEVITEILNRLEKEYPDAECALHHQDVFQLIVAVALSAQTTDKSVNQVTPALFAAYPDAFAPVSYTHLDVYKRQIVSHALGDPTPKMQGRLTINPAAHMDPLGFLALLFAGFGWGVPVQVDPRYYKHRRLGEILVSFAGVAMNFLIAIIFTLVIRIGFEINPMWFYSGMGETVLQILSGIISINIVLMVFNLLPVPPLDGFGIVTEIFNLRKYNWYYTVYNNGMLILLALIIFNVTDRVLTPSVSFIYSWLMNVIIL